jgi:hypothetical protein
MMWPPCLRALHVQLLGEQHQLVFADHVLARIDQTRVEAPAVEPFGDVAEGLDTLDDVRRVRFPLDDRAGFALGLEHVAADPMLDAARARLEARHQRFAVLGDRGAFARVEHRLA